MKKYPSGWNSPKLPGRFFGEPTFVCLPGEDPMKVAMEASVCARQFSQVVRFIDEGQIHEIGPNDIPFQQRSRIVTF